MRLRFFARAAAPLFLLAAAFNFVACADLAPLAEQSCGNSVVELTNGEECDSHSEFAGVTCALPGEKNQCRYVCSGGRACPPGWGCGLDGVCRNPIGSYRSIKTFSLGGRVAIPGDFQGDKKPSVLQLSDDDSIGRRFARIVDPDQDVGSSPLSIAAPMASPTITDLDGDGYADVAFADLRGIAVMRGGASQSGGFPSFPSIQLPYAGAHLRVVPMDVIAARPGDEIIGWIDRSASGAGVSLIHVADESNPEGELVKLDGAEDTLTPIRWGRLDKTAACDQIVIAHRGDDHAVIFTPCKRAGGKVVWNEGGATRSVKLPSSAQPIKAGVALADIDRDGNVDLLLGVGDPKATDGTSTNATYILHGDGAGGFTEAGTSTDTAVPFTIPGGADIPQTLPLAFADLNGDNVTDFVIASGVITSQPGATYALTARNLAGSWDSAVVGDMNGDKKPDVIGASSMQLNLEFFNNAGDGFFNTTSIATLGRPTKLTIGDFDGDLIQDVAFAEAGTSDAAWTIAYGAAAGAPSVVKQMGRLPSVDQIAPARLAELGAVDRIDDLVMISEVPATKADSFVFSIGRGERTMLAPFALRSGTTNDFPIALTSGHLGSKQTNAVGVVAVTAESKLRLWYLADIFLSSSNTVVTSSSPIDGFYSDDGEAGTGFRYGVHLAAGDLDDDSDGLEEIVMVGPYGAATDADKKSALIIAKVDATTHAITLSTPVVLPLHSTLYSPLVLADVDHDGKLDAIFKPEDDSPQDVYVMYGDGKGNLDAAHPQKLHRDGGFTSFTCGYTGPRCDLFVASNHSVFRVDFDSSRNPTFAEMKEFAITPDDATQPPYFAISSGDYDGDGLPDFALSRDTDLSVFYANVVLQ